MKRRTKPERIVTRIASRKAARALCRISPMTAREVRAIWTATDKRIGGGRYRWYRTGLRAEIMRLTTASPAWPAARTA